MRIAPLGTLATKERPQLAVGRHDRDRSFPPPRAHRVKRPVERRTGIRRCGLPHLGGARAQDRPQHLFGTRPWCSVGSELSAPSTDHGEAGKAQNDFADTPAWGDEQELVEAAKIVVGETKPGALERRPRRQLRMIGRLEGE
jgi:hypothetical protein